MHGSWVTRVGCCLPQPLAPSLLSPALAPTPPPLFLRARPRSTLGPLPDFLLTSGKNARKFFRVQEELVADPLTGGLPLLHIAARWLLLPLGGTARRSAPCPCCVPFLLPVCFPAGGLLCAAACCAPPAQPPACPPWPGLPSADRPRGRARLPAVLRLPLQASSCCASASCCARGSSLRS